MSECEDQVFCVLCHTVVGNLGKHFKNTHKVKHPEERKILINLCKGRINVRCCPCSIPGCNYVPGKHLDRHIERYHIELSAEAKNRFLKHAKVLQATKLLSELRQTNPEPPMVTTLDLEEIQVPAYETTQPQQEPGPVCGMESCIELFNRQSKEMQAVKAENKRLLERITDLQRSLAVCKRVAAGMRKGPSVLAQPVLHPVRRRRRAAAAAAAQQQQEEQQQEEQESSYGKVDPEQQVEGHEAAEVIEPARVETIEVGETEEQEQSESAVARSAAKSKTPDASEEGRLFTWSAGSGKGNKMHLLKLPESMSMYLDRFQSFHLHEFGTQKMKEGASSRVSRVKSFLHYMSLGKIRLSDWQFLYDVEKIKAWIREMRNSGKKITTVRYYLHNIAQFLEYLLNVRPKHVKLTLEQNREILQLVEKARKETSRDIIVHQNRVKRKKMDQIPDAETIRTCLRVAPAAIADLLDKLETDSRKTTTRYLLYGYLTAYWACMSGHRPSVFINMKEDEVVASEKNLTDQGVLIRVADHKTTVRFGEANLAVTPAEFDWVRRLLAIKRTMRSRNRFVLFTLGKHPFKNVNRYLQMAWDEMGLKGEINFTLIRTALADGAKSLLPEEERRKVSFSMCHDTRTADRFYTRNPNLSDAMEVRKTMERLLSGLGLMPTPGRAGALDPKRLTLSKPEDAPGPSDAAPPGPSGTTQAKTGGKKTRKRQRHTTTSSDSDSQEDINVPYQESGSSMSSLEEMEESSESSEEEREKIVPVKRKQLSQCVVNISPLKTANLRVQRTREASQKVKRVLRKDTGM